MSLHLNPADPAPADFRAAITREIDAFLDRVQARSHQVSALLDQQFVITKTFTQAGKRLRPAFGYWGYVAVAGQPVSDELLRAMAAFELLHIGVLMHDDLIDSSDSRRGLPAAHRQWEAWHRGQAGFGDSAAFGRHLALILGDQLLVWSAELAEQSGLAPAAWQRASSFFHQMRSEVNAGQILDICAEFGLGDDDLEANAYRVLAEKTSRYTVQRPVQFGAAVAGAGEQILTGLGIYGLHLGRAFQLRDDLLGVFGDSATIGKPSADDLREGKRTVLIAQGLARADAAARANWKQILGNPFLDTDQITWARQELTSSGARSEVEARIAADYATALAALSELPLTAEGRQGLTRLAEICVDRTH